VISGAENNIGAISIYRGRFQRQTRPMNSPITKVLSVIAASAFFTVLFYRHDIGLNLFLFELLIIGWLAFTKRITKDPEVVLTVLGTFLTGLMVVVHNSVLAIFVNILSMFIMTGVLLYPKSGSLPHSTALGLVHMATAQFEFFKQLGQTGSSNGLFGRVFNGLRIVIIPIVVVVVFIAIYSAANPVFDGFLSNITSALDDFITLLSEWVEFGFFFCFILGMLVSDFLLLQTVERNLAQSADSATDNMQRKRSRFFTMSLSQGLKRELRSGVLMLIILNLLLLLVNAIDIYWVWFNFEWEGDYLKQFVHEGTYLLIISILISIGISIYLFRGNQNFYQKSQLLKTLVVTWLVQNAVLVISVGIRNMHYISYYALAHKRIGVFFFLIATLIGLIIVIQKVRNRKTFHYILRTNSISVYSILVFMALFNWDVIIAKYNFKHYETTFTHLNFLSNLSDSALPYLERDTDFLALIEESNSPFPSERSYIDKWEYAMRIREKKTHFLGDWQQRDWRSWNWAYQKTYSQVSEANQ
jgi:hypothetical protein